MKKLISLLLTFVLTAGLITPVFANELEKENKIAVDKVEISFAVGDSTLKINGQDVTVETPYVVDGTTLVPMRVISESFGADVGWNGDTREVTVTYGELEIKLTIGSKSVYVNGNEEELLAAPEISGGSTMLPLRFITESFGADVGYEEETARITVVKEITNSNSIRDYAAILKRSTKQMVGDSYLGWSIKRPADFMLAERSFDGRYNQFTSNSSGAYYGISVFEKDEVDDADTILKYYREIASSYSAIDIGQKKNNVGTGYTHVQFKDSEDYVDFRTYYAEEYTYRTTTVVPTSDGLAAFNNLCGVVDSFRSSFLETETEDLSDVNEEGMRTFNSREYDLKIDIPGELAIDDSNMSVNRFYFYGYSEGNTPIDSVRVGVYSNQEGHTSDIWVENDYKRNKDIVNQDFSKFDTISKTEVDGKPAQFYSYEINYNEETTLTKDMFIDAGDYFYNVAVSVKKEGSWESAMDAIFGSIKIGEIDKDEIGKLIRIEETGDLKFDEYMDEENKYSVSVPSTWMQYDVENGFVAYDTAGFMAVVQNTTEGLTFNGFMKELPIIYNEYKSNKNIELISKAFQTQSIGGGKLTYHFIEYKQILDDGSKIMVREGYIYTVDNIFTIEVRCGELFYGETLRTIFDKVVASFKFL